MSAAAKLVRHEKAPLTALKHPRKTWKTGAEIYTQFRLPSRHRPAFSGGDWEGEAPAEPRLLHESRLGGSLALPGALDAVARKRPRQHRLLGIILILQKRIASIEHQRQPRPVEPMNRRARPADHRRPTHAASPHARHQRL